LPNRSKTTTPPPPPPDEPPIEKTTSKDDKLIPILVVKDLPEVHSSSILTNVAVQGCLERLKQAASVSPRAGSEMNRKEASDTAKASTDTYVMMIQLEVDPVRGNPRATVGYDDPRHVYVSYVLFSPATGKIKASGNVYQRHIGPGGVPLPGPVPNTNSSSEFSLRYAGREAADRVLSAIGLPLPSERRY
jgi:hypothetical protein